MKVWPTWQWVYWYFLFLFLSLSLDSRAHKPQNCTLGMGRKNSKRNLFSIFLSRVLRRKNRWDGDCGGKSLPMFSFFFFSHLAYSGEDKPGSQNNTLVNTEAMYIPKTERNSFSLRRRTRKLGPWGPKCVCVLCVKSSLIFFLLSLSLICPQGEPSHRKCEMT